jgi:hypothetical protein
MYDFIINTPSLQGPVIPTWVPSLGGLPINSPLVGSFLGVVLAFALNYIYKFAQDYKSKMYYKNSIKLEIELCIKRLSIVGDLLPSDRWTATLNSGAMRFFSVSEADELSRAYEAIRNYNYEAHRTRDLGEDYRRYSAIFGGQKKMK